MHEFHLYDLSLSPPRFITQEVVMTDPVIKQGTIRK